MMHSIILPFLLAVLLSNPASALDKPLSYLRKNSISTNKKNNDAAPRDLQMKEPLPLDSSFVARYHNKGLANVMKNEDALSSFPVMTQTIISFLQKDDGFPEFSPKEAAALVEETFIVSRDGVVDAEATMNQALKEKAAASPVAAAIIEIIAKVKSEDISSIDEMIRTVESAAKKSGRRNELEAFEAFAAVARASNKFWTAYVEERIEDADGSRRALKKCKWWQKLFIILADAIGAALGILIGGPFAPLYAVIFAIAMSGSTQSGFGCTWN